MERKNANIDDVIRTVETASAKELEELAGIREAVEDLKGGRVATVDPVSRSVSALNRTIENSRPDFVANAPSVDPIVDAMKRLNLGDVSRVVQEGIAQQEQQAKSTTPKGKKRRRKAIPEDIKAQRTEAAEHAREMFDQKGGAQKSQNQRDARGRFIGKSGSKAAAEDARAERAEKARRKEDDERLNAESGLLKKLSKVAEGIGNPSETRAVDALGYAVAGPLWAAGKELGGISKEVGGALNGARKSIADVIRGNDDNSRRKGFFRRKSQNSADVVQVNTQKRTVQELQEQTSEIKEGNDKILSALDQIAKNTGKKKGGLLSKLFSLLGKGAGGVASLLMGRGMLKKAGALAFGALGAKKLVGMLRGGGKKTLAHEGGDLAARAAGKLGLKAVGKGALRAIPLVGTVAGGIYDAVTGWNDTEAQRRAFGLKSGQDPSFQQKAAYTLANVLDMGGLVSGISSAIGEVLKSLGFEDSSLPEPEVSVGAYRYALQMRPAAPGAIPEGNKAILPRPDEGDPYYEYARYGIVTYDTPLSDQQMSEYDLKLLPREDSFDFLAKTLTNGPFGKYAQKALELATSSPDEFRVMLKTQFQKTFPNIAFPGGAGIEKMVQSMINALQAEVGEITQPEPVPAQPDETVSEADAEANKAIEYLNSVMDMQSTDMAEIRNARGNVREAIAALQAAGRFEENEELVNGAARHLADLLVAIQKAGVAA